MQDNKSKLVYSTDRQVPQKKGPAEKNIPSTTCTARQRITVRLDRKGRGGKSVTLIDGVRMPDQEKEALLKQLKTRLGTGGTVKDDTLEIQGDHCDALMTALAKMGYRAKRSGG